MILRLISSDFPEPSTIVVLSFSTVALSIFKPVCSLKTVAPVSVAISCNIAVFLSPNPGAFTAATLIVPRSLFTTNVASASPRMSSHIIKIDLPACALDSKAGSKSLTTVTVCSAINMYGFSRTASILSSSVTK